MPKSFLLLLFSWNVILKNRGKIGLVLAQDQCNSNVDCASSKYCCKGRYSFDQTVCRSSCVGLTCNTDIDCGGIEEYCGPKKTCKKSIGDECYKHTDCTAKYCCTQRFIIDKNVCRNSCIGEKCHSNRDCGGLDAYCGPSNICQRSRDECFSNFGCGSSKFCCKRKFLSDRNVCRRDCIGETCNLDSDCGGPNESCNSEGKCQKSASPWAIPVIVVSIILSIGVFVAISVYRCRRKSSYLPRGGVVVNRTPEQRAATVLALEETHSSTQTSDALQHDKSFPPPYYNQDQDCHLQTQQFSYSQSQQCPVPAPPPYPSTESQPYQPPEIVLYPPSTSQYYPPPSAPPYVPNDDQQYQAFQPYPYSPEHSPQSSHVKN